MPKTPKNKDFDQLISHKLHQAKVQPPDHIWQNIQPHIPQYSPWGKLTMSPATSILMNITVVLSVLITIYFVHKSAFYDVSEDKTLTEQHPLIYQHINDNYDEHNNDVATVSTTSAQNSVHAGSSSPVQQQNTELSQLESPTQPDFEQFTNNMSINQIIPLRTKSFNNISLSPITDKLQKTSTLKQHLVFPLDNFTTFAMKAGYHPEFYSYDTTLFGSHMPVEHKIFTTVQIFMDDFFIETGISIGQHRFNNTYKTDIWFNQVVAQYERVDSVEFIPYWDPNTNSWEYEPYFHTTPVTITQLQHETKIKMHDDTYLYAHIPFSIGIQKKIRRLSFEPSIGLAYSMLIATSAKDHTVEVHNSPDVLRTEKTLLTPSRLLSFWSFHCAFNFAYAISPSVDILFAPTYRYSLGPTFQGESPSRQSPLAFGFSTALRYKWIRP